MSSVDGLRWLVGRWILREVTWRGVIIAGPVSRVIKRLNMLSRLFFMESVRPRMDTAYPI